MRRNPARWLAPLALVATATVTYAVVHSGLSAASRHTSTTRTQVVHGTIQRSHTSKTKFYAVHPGDTLASISHKTGVSLATLHRLNPSLNPNSLQTSQRVRLRR